MKMNPMLAISALFILVGCSSSEPPADLVLYNTKIYTVVDESPTAEAVAIRGGRIVRVGSTAAISRLIGDSTQVMDLQGKFVYPGFVEGHAHIMGIGDNLVNVDLMGAKSYEEVIALVKARAAETPKGEWILGRGWHQDKWERSPEGMFRGFPTHHSLSEAVPDHPVWLTHASGHAGLANAQAMELAGIAKETPDPAGGEIFRGLNGSPTGIFNETAEDLIWAVTPKNDPALQERKLRLAVAECLRHGITSLHEAGSGAAEIALYEKLAAANELKIRLHVMLHGRDQDLLETYFAQGPQSGLYDHHLNIRSIKLYSDGALGSRGAWLLEPYTDAPGVHGHNVTPMNEIADVVEGALEHGFQVCTHAIGDRANREVLDIYEASFQQNPVTDHRFRIEHAQHIHPEDIPRFAKLGVLPAMQAIHMSSDRPWAIDRLGKERIENGAYMWRALIDQGSVIVNGTDAPVEPVTPLASFYASVSRKTLQGTPEGGYEPAQKMTRAEALKSYTIWAAFGAFMEQQVGSVEAGKLADLVVLDRDIMTIDEAEILQTQVLFTISGGEVVFDASAL